MNTIIQGLFNLTYELADDAIGWAGGVGRSNVGRDTEGKVAGVFIAGGRAAAAGMTRGAGMTGLGGKTVAGGGTGKEPPLMPSTGGKKVSS